MNLFLIGYRCSGKTTIGKLIAVTMKWSFVDSDLQLVRECGKSVKEIVEGEGWEGFRRRERSIIRQICKKDRQVVATGGGVVLDSGNVEAMKTNGIVIWLCANVETIKHRMLQDETTENFRPALTDKGPEAEIEDMLLKRNPFYENASDFCVHTDKVPLNEITAKIIQEIKEKIGA